MNKKIILKLGILTLALILNASLSASLWAAAPTKKSEFTKSINKEFDISKKGKVAIKGKYGDISITTWNKNKVKFDIRIIVKAPSKEKADELFKRIAIDFRDQGNLVEAVFNMKDGGRSWGWRSYKSVSYKIHFDVKIPSTNDVNLYNKYGNIHLTDISGNASLENKYGDIKIGDAKNVDLILGYGKADLGHIKDLDVQIKYSKLDVESAKNAKIASKYSRIYIDKAMDIRSESKYDKYYLGDINDLRNYGKYDDFEIKSLKSIDATAKYTDYDIGDFSGTANFDMQYGDADIKQVKNGFESVSFKGKHADLIFDLKGKGANIEINTKHTKVKLPSDLKTEHYIEERAEINVEGKIRGGGNRIKATAAYGSVIIY